jgi:hypothetical protein
MTKRTIKRTTKATPAKRTKSAKRAAPSLSPERAIELRDFAVALVRRHNGIGDSPVTRPIFFREPRGFFDISYSGPVSGIFNDHMLTVSYRHKVEKQSSVGLVMRWSDAAPSKIAVKEYAPDIWEDRLIAVGEGRL